VALYFLLGFLHSRHFGVDFLSTYRGCESGFHVSYHPSLYFQLTNLHDRSIAKSQLLNIPTAFLTIAIIAGFGLWADTARLPRPLYPLLFLIIIMACYSVLYTFPNTGGVYAATIIASSFASSWYPLMCKSQPPPPFLPIQPSNPI